ncbi:MAG: cytochrome P450 [Gammaproteobacteria bacterium]|nr:cytochrome P450 [Gammaproteobacteria bacterium]
MTQYAMHFSCNPADPGFFQNPYPVYDEMRSLGPCFFWEEYGYWCFPGFDEVSELLRDRRFGREGQQQALPSLNQFEKNSLLEMDPPAHTRLRRLVNRAFVSSRVEKQKTRIERLAHDLIDEFAPHGEVNLLTAYAEVIPVVVICELLGVSSRMAGQLLEWSHNMVAIYEHSNDEGVERTADTAASEFETFIKREIDAKRADPGEDLLSELILAEEEGDRLNIDELVATCMLLLNAGHEATVHGIGNGVKSILEQDIDVRRWFASRESTNAVVEECLRYDPPLHMFTRNVREDLNYAGRDFRQGDVVGLMLGAANRDPDKFLNAHEFDLERGGEGHVSFSAGIHFCVAAPLARLELEVALSVLFQRLPTIRLAREPVYADRYHFHGLERLDLVW